MSLHDLSNLAVQDITDEAAAVHSGGISFQGLNSSNAGFTRNYPNNTLPAAGATIESFNFAGNLLPARTVSKVVVAGHPLGGRAFRYTAYSGGSQTGSTFPLNFTGNGTITIGSPLAGNVGSARISRTA